MNNEQSTYFKSSFGSIYYKESGPENAPAIIMIHGVGMNHITFDQQVRELSKKYRTLVWDLPGHGKSSLDNYNKRFTILSAECLNELMVHIGIDKAFFVGQSMGSLVVQHFQHKHPDKVFGSAHVPGIELKRHVGKWAKLFVPLMMGMLHLFPAKSFYKAFGKHRSVDKDVQKYLAEAIAECGKKLALRITKDMVDDLIDKAPEIQPRPLLITYGEKDLFFIRKACEKWSKNANGSICYKIKRANHIANQDNSFDFNEQLLKFLGSLNY